ncbi:MAG: carboxypeptidase regulatory-like domain-containing protein [Planctomycetes bacterium]|nr:carboxypeptidase regulatory-like domain-containing protein [Planctomycetota bacterium]
MRRTTLLMQVIAVGLMFGFGADRVDAKGKRYEEANVEDGGTIVGVVRFEGKVPARKTLKVTTEEEPCHRGPILSEELVVSDEKGVQWAVASIKGIKRGKPFPAEDSGQPIQLDQKGCRFIPHVLLAPQRRTFKILNSDGILHNVHAHAKKNAGFNKAQPPKVKELDVSFKRPEKVRISCDVHAWMGAWIVVTEHPYYAVSGSDGTFRFEDVPAGTHLVEIWHETLGKQTQEVTVSPGAETEVEFVLKK